MTSKRRRENGVCEFRGDLAVRSRRTLSTGFAGSVVATISATARGSSLLTPQILKTTPLSANDPTRERRRLEGRFSSVSTVIAPALPTLQARIVDLVIWPMSPTSWKRTPILVENSYLASVTVKVAEDAPRRMITVLRMAGACFRMFSVGASGNISAPAPLTRRTALLALALTALVALVLKEKRTVVDVDSVTVVAAQT